MTATSDTTPHWPHVDEDSREDLMAERRRLINCLAAIEEALREKHGFTTDSINPQTVPWCPNGPACTMPGHDHA